MECQSETKHTKLLFEFAHLIVPLEYPVVSAETTTLATALREKYGNNASWGKVNWRWGGGGVTEVGGWKRKEGRRAVYKYERVQSRPQ